MAAPPAPSYGTPNLDLIGRWLRLPPEDDGPFWALNLMRYRDVAVYADTDPARPDAPVSGREADDAYAPLGPLAAVGAVVAFHGDVVDQPGGQPAWDRVGIVRYPSRAAFFAMQQRDDFQAQHVHKEAGMSFTIVLACLPTAHHADAPAGGRLVLVVDAGAPVRGADERADGVDEVAAFAVEGVIIGDDRTYDRARFLRAADDAALAAVTAAATTTGDAHVLVLEPVIDELVATIAAATTATTATAGTGGTGDGRG